MAARNVFILFMLASGSVGCASLHPRAQTSATRIDFMGEADEVEAARTRYRERMAQTLGQLAEPQALASLSTEVVVLEKTLPAGIEVVGSVVTAQPHSGLKVVGTLDVTPEIASPFLFSDYDSPARKAACYWQTPLTWVTLSMWALVVPLNYPCWGKDLSVPEAYGLIRASAQAAGADLVVLTKILRSKDTFVSARGILLRDATAEPAGSSRSGILPAMRQVALERSTRY